MKTWSWTPTDEIVNKSNLQRFLTSAGISNFDELIQRCADDATWFWEDVVDFLGLRWQRRFDRILDVSAGVPWAKWFVGGQYNVSENCLDRWLDKESIALISENEDGASRQLTYRELALLVEDVRGRLVAMGVEKGDRVAIYQSMTPEAVATFLACVRMGAVVVTLFSGYGWAAVEKRLANAEARYVVTQDQITRKGREISLSDVLAVVVENGYTPEQVAVWRFKDDGGDLPPKFVAWSRSVSAKELLPAETSAVDDPLLLAYTSGSTGRPKGAVHTHGGLPIKAAVEFALCFDVQSQDRVLWISDMGWILGPILISGVLSSGGTLVLYDGAIDTPTPVRLWELIDRHSVTHFGLAPTAIRVLRRAVGDRSLDEFDLSSVRILAGTGEPWDEAGWRWFSEVFGNDRCPIINYAGGTEVGGGIIAGNPLVPQKPCSFPGASPGMDADVFDVQGQPVRGEIGELVVKQPWPGMSRGFWGDDQRYLETYWNRWPDVWVHGDWASIDADGCWFVHGRSDDAINVAGRRVGPSEIEEVLIGHPRVSEAAAVALPDEVKGTSVACFIVIEDLSTPEFIDELGDMVEDNLGRPLRPAVILAIDELPKTSNGKILRRVVRNVFMGLDPGDLSTLENPSSLEHLEALRKSTVT